MRKHVLEEAKRCLQCKKPLCKQGCPVSTPINEMIQILLDDGINEAGKMLFENNPLSVICSLVCPHEVQCEGHCVLSRKSSGVQISNIENYISSYYLDRMEMEKKDNGKKVAIIGSGPAGITLAFMLARKGYKITIFEAHDKIGGVLRYGIPEFRLQKGVLDKIEERLMEAGVVIRPNTLIGPVIGIDDLKRDGYKAIFIGTGVWNPKKMGIKGETLGNVHFAIDYLKNPEVYRLGKKVTVIGAGNVAMDVARTILRNSHAEVTIMYRKGLEDIPARVHEREYAQMDGVKFELYKSPVEITEKGIIYKETSYEEIDGKKVLKTYDEEKFFESDSAIIAVSQGPKSNIVSREKEISVDNIGRIITDDMGRTTKDGVFSCGDVVTGAQTVVMAVKFAKEVAESIDEYVNGLED